MSKFNEIIDFAINREYEAAKLYKDLQAIAKKEASKQLLKEFENMELQHAKILEEFSPEKLSSNYVIPKVDNLNLSENFDVPPASEEMNFQEVLMIAIKNEERAFKLYSDLAQRAEDDYTKKLFERLAHEESKHKYQLESIYDNEIFKEN